MDKNKLRRIVKKIINEEFSSDEETVDFHIKEYLETKDKLEKFMEEFGHLITKHKEMTSDEKKKFTKIQSLMGKFKMVKHLADKLVFEIVKSPKYKVVRPDYKEVFKEAMERLNGASQNVVNNVIADQLVFKEKQTTNTLHISDIKESSNGEMIDDLREIEQGMLSFVSATKELHDIFKEQS